MRGEAASKVFIQHKLDLLHSREVLRRDGQSLDVSPRARAILRNQGEAEATKKTGEDEEFS